MQIRYLHILFLSIISRISYDLFFSNTLRTLFQFFYILLSNKVFLQKTFAIFINTFVHAHDVKLLDIAHHQAQIKITSYPSLKLPNHIDVNYNMNSSQWVELVSEGAFLFSFTCIFTKIQYLLRTQMKYLNRECSFKNNFITL